MIRGVVLQKTIVLFVAQTLESGQLLRGGFGAKTAGGAQQQQQEYVSHDRKRRTGITLATADFHSFFLIAAVKVDRRPGRNGGGDGRGEVAEYACAVHHFAVHDGQHGFELQYILVAHLEIVV